MGRSKRAETPTSWWRRLCDWWQPTTGSPRAPRKRRARQASPAGPAPGTSPSPAGDSAPEFSPPQSRGLLTRWLGNAGERLAARHLRRLGMRILHRQYRTPMGEIDLIAQDGQTLVFVEVKTRRGISAGLPAEAVDRRKQAQLTRLALVFLKKHRLLDRPARFDVVAIVWPEAGGRPQVTHYPNAFEAVGHGQMFS